MCKHLRGKFDVCKAKNRHYVSATARTTRRTRASQLGVRVGDVFVVVLELAVQIQSQHLFNQQESDVQACRDVAIVAPERAPRCKQRACRISWCRRTCWARPPTAPRWCWSTADAPANDTVSVRARSAVKPTHRHRPLGPLPAAIAVLEEHGAVLAVAGLVSVPALPGAQVRLRVPLLLPRLVVRTNFVRVPVSCAQHSCEHKERSTPNALALLDGEALALERRKLAIGT